MNIIYDYANSMKDLRSLKVILYLLLIKPGTQHVVVCSNLFDLKLKPSFFAMLSATDVGPCAVVI